MSALCGSLLGGKAVMEEEEKGGGGFDRGGGAGCSGVTSKKEWEEVKTDECKEGKEYCGKC